MSEEQSQITVNEMDNLIEKLRDAKDEHKIKSDAAKIAKAAYDTLQLKLLAALEELDKDTYIAKSGRITRVIKMAVRVPKTLDEKRAFFNWLRQNRGDEVADSYMSVNSQSLNTLYNEMVDEYAGRGEILTMEGIEPPTIRESLSFRQV